MHRMISAWEDMQSDVYPSVSNLIYRVLNSV